MLIEMFCKLRKRTKNFTLCKVANDKMEYTKENDTVARKEITDASN